MPLKIEGVGPDVNSGEGALGPFSLDSEGCRCPRHGQGPLAAMLS